MLKKKLIAVGLCGCLLWNGISTAFASAGAPNFDDTEEISVETQAELSKEVDAALAEIDPAELQIRSRSFLLLEMSTGTVLVEGDADLKMPPASITKIMSLLLVMEAMEAGKFTVDDLVTASDHASSMGGAQIWLEPGEVMSVNDLLKATAISSANDATVALAEFVSGSEETFVAQMNARAAELGMANTHFCNATGLDDPDHYTTARDIAIMSRELLKHEKIFEYSTVWMDSLRDGKNELVNTNKLIRFYKGANGLKTGTTSGAGYCLSASAERDSMTLIAVTLGADNTDDRFLSARRLLDYGFANYELAAPEFSPEELTSVKIVHGVESQVLPQVQESARILLKKGAAGQITHKVVLEEMLEAPVKEGDPIGKIVFELDGEIVGESPVVASQTIERMTFWKGIGFLFKAFFGMAFS